MTDAYADTSFLASLYLPETTTAKARALLHDRRTPLAFTPLHQLELRTAIRARVFRGEITPEERTAAFAAVESDLASGILKEISLDWPEIFHQAEQLSAAHVERIGTRSLDVLHVAAAVTLGATTFCTFDKRQTAFASAVGLEVEI